MAWAATWRTWLPLRPGRPTRNPGAVLQRRRAHQDADPERPPTSRWWRPRWPVTAPSWPSWRPRPEPRWRRCGSESRPSGQRRGSSAGERRCGVGDAAGRLRAKRLDLTFRALDRAKTYSEQTKDEAPSSWLGIPDSSFVERQQAIILAQFGEAEALSLLERLDRSTPAVFRRYRVTLATDRALTYAHNKQVEPSAAALTSAVLLNQQRAPLNEHVKSCTSEPCLIPTKTVKLSKQ